jgi:hypothetical protein
MISTLDTHELVKDLKASGFSDDQAEAVTRAVTKARDIDLSNLATKTDLAELKADMIKWVVGIAFAQIATIIAVVKLFPGPHP